MRGKLFNKNSLIKGIKVLSLWSIIIKIISLTKTLMFDKKIFNIKRIGYE